MIVVKDLHKGFDEVQVLKGISTTFHPEKPVLLLDKVVLEKQFF